jgi:hypothetical protein
MQMYPVCGVSAARERDLEQDRAPPSVARMAKGGAGSQRQGQRPSPGAATAVRQVHIHLKHFRPPLDWHCECVCTSVVVVVGRFLTVLCCRSWSLFHALPVRQRTLFRRTVSVDSNANSSFATTRKRGPLSCSAQWRKRPSGFWMFSSRSVSSVRPQFDYICGLWLRRSRVMNGSAWGSVSLGRSHQ